MAALGREVAAEAEHVRPRGQPQVGQCGELAEAQACADEAAGVLADGQLGELIGRGNAMVEGAGAFGGLGGVLGHVGGHPGVGEVPGGGDRPGVVLASPRQRAGRQSRGSWGIEVDGTGGLGDGRGKQGDRGPGRRG